MSAIGAYIMTASVAMPLFGEKWYYSIALVALLTVSSFIVSVLYNMMRVYFEDSCEEANGFKAGLRRASSMATATGIFDAMVMIGLSSNIAVGTLLSIFSMIPVIGLFPDVLIHTAGTLVFYPFINLFMNMC